ncbi:MAG: hypothetical protein QX197_11845 [Methylococcaceae bacterium]
MSNNVNLNGNSYSDNATPANANDRNIGGIGNRTWFFALLQDLVAVLANAMTSIQAWSAQAQAAAGAGGGTIFPAITAANAGQSLVVNAAGTGYAAQSISGFNNFLRNPNFDIWQKRPIGTAPALLSAGQYMADGWCPFHYQSVTASRQPFVQSGEHLGGSKYVQRLSPTLSYSTFGQVIANEDTIKLRSKKVTLTGYIRFSSVSMLSAGFTGLSVLLGYTAGAADSSSYSSGFVDAVLDSVVFSQGALPGLWKKITISGTVPAGANNVVTRIQLTAVPTTINAADWYELSDFDLRIGEGGADRRPYAVELVLCQRFYEPVSGYANPSAADLYKHFPYKVTKRVIPTLFAPIFYNSSYTGGTFVSPDENYCIQNNYHAVTDGFYIPVSAEI